MILPASHKRHSIIDYLTERENAKQTLVTSQITRQTHKFCKNVPANVPSISPASSHASVLWRNIFSTKIKGLGLFALWHRRKDRRAVYVTVSTTDQTGCLRCSFGIFSCPTRKVHKSKIPREEKMKISKKRSKYPKKHPFFIKNSPF